MMFSRPTGGLIMQSYPLKPHNNISIVLAVSSFSSKPVPRFPLLVLWISEFVWFSLRLLYRWWAFRWSCGAILLISLLHGGACLVWLVHTLGPISDTRILRGLSEGVGLGRMPSCYVIVGWFFSACPVVGWWIHSPGLSPGWFRARECSCVAIGPLPFARPSAWSVLCTLWGCGPLILFCCKLRMSLVLHSCLCSSSMCLVHSLCSSLGWLFFWWGVGYRRTWHLGWLVGLIGSHSS